MTDDGNRNRQSDRPTTKKTHQATGSGDQLTRAQWEALHSDPDMADDLGYELCEWEQFDSLDGTDQVMYLPKDELSLKGEAFIVAEPDALRDLGSFC